MSVNRGKHILSDFLDTVWFIHPENFRFLLDLATRNINFDENNFNFINKEFQEIEIEFNKFNILT